MRMSMKKTNNYMNRPCFDSFVCEACGKLVVPEGAGTKHRNHCPHCLTSLHVDDTPGDRAANCDGVMEPIGVWVRKNGEWAILHRCTRCGHISSNRLAADDDPATLLSIALKPLACPPFPMEGLAESLALPLTTWESR